jgi:hypothetical protein
MSTLGPTEASVNAFSETHPVPGHGQRKRRKPIETASASLTAADAVGSPSEKGPVSKRGQAPESRSSKCRKVTTKLVNGGTIIMMYEASVGWQPEIRQQWACLTEWKKIYKQPKQTWTDHSKK